MDANTQKQLLQAIVESLTQGTKPDQLVQVLIEKGLPKENAMQMVAAGIEYLQEGNKPNQEVPMVSATENSPQMPTGEEEMSMKQYGQMQMGGNTKLQNGTIPAYLTDGNAFIEKMKEVSSTKTAQYPMEMDDVMPMNLYEEYGGCVDCMKKGGIHIKEANKGKFTAQATAHDMGVQEFANYVMRNKEDFSPSTVKRANFARNAKKFKHEDGGELPQAQTGKFMPYNPSEDEILTEQLRLEEEERKANKIKRMPSRGFNSMKSEPVLPELNRPEVSINPEYQPKTILKNKYDKTPWQEYKQTENEAFIKNTEMYPEHLLSLAGGLSDEGGQGLLKFLAGAGLATMGAYRGISKIPQAIQNVKDRRYNKKLLKENLTTEDIDELRSGLGMDPMSRIKMKEYQMTPKEEFDEYRKNMKFDPDLMNILFSKENEQTPSNSNTVTTDKTSTTKPFYMNKFSLEKPKFEFQRKTPFQTPSLIDKTGPLFNNQSNEKSIMFNRPNTSEQEYENAMKNLQFINEFKKLGGNVELLKFLPKKFIGGIIAAINSAIPAATTTTTALSTGAAAGANAGIGAGTTGLAADAITSGVTNAGTANTATNLSTTPDVTGIGANANNVTPGIENNPVIDNNPVTGGNATASNTSSGGFDFMKQMENERSKGPVDNTITSEDNPFSVVGKKYEEMYKPTTSDDKATIEQKESVIENIKKTEENPYTSPEDKNPNNNTTDKTEKFNWRDQIKPGGGGGGAPDPYAGESIVQGLSMMNSVLANMKRKRNQKKRTFLGNTMNEMGNESVASYGDYTKNAGPAANFRLNEGIGAWAKFGGDFFQDGGERVYPPNTELSPAEEQQFQQWFNYVNNRGLWDANNPAYDYRGAWLNAKDSPDLTETENYLRTAEEPHWWTVGANNKWAKKKPAMLRDWFDQKIIQSAAAGMMGDYEYDPTTVHVTDEEGNILALPKRTLKKQAKGGITKDQLPLYKEGQEIVVDEATLKKIIALGGQVEIIQDFTDNKLKTY